jgi:hypothetical protein
MQKNRFLTLAILAAIGSSTNPAGADIYSILSAPHAAAETDGGRAPSDDSNKNSDVIAAKTVLTKDIKSSNNSQAQIELEGSVKRAAKNFKSMFAQKYQDNYTVFGIGPNGFVVPAGTLPEIAELLWQTGSVNYNNHEISFVLPDMLIHAAKGNLRLTQTVIRGISENVIGQQFNLVDLPDFDVELHVLGVDKELTIIGLGFILKGIQAGPRIHTTSFSDSGVNINGSSIYLGSTIDYNYFLKDHPEVSPGRKSVLREIVGEILGSDFVDKARTDELIDSFSKVSKDIIVMNYLYSHCLNRASLDGMTGPVRIVDENYQLTRNGAAILKSVAKDLKAGVKTRGGS